MQRGSPISVRRPRSLDEIGPILLISPRKVNPRSPAGSASRFWRYDESESLSQRRKGRKEGRPAKKRNFKKAEHVNAVMAILPTLRLC